MFDGAGQETSAPIPCAGDVRMRLAGRAGGMGASASATAMSRSVGRRGGSGARNFAPKALRGSAGEASLAALGSTSAATTCGLTGGTGAGAGAGPAALA